MKNSFINIMRKPDSILIQTENSPVRFEEPTDYIKIDARVEYKVENSKGKVILYPSNEAILRIKLRWNEKVTDIQKVLNDSWTFAVTDIAWDSIKPENILPWYFCTYDGESTHGYGVMTGANSLCSWQFDTSGISLWLDVRCGGKGVELEEPLEAAIVVSRQGHIGENSYHSCIEFCKVMCEKPNLPKTPVFGSNNWYWAYGDISHDIVMGEADTLSELCRDTQYKPYMVIDDGWQKFNQRLNSIGYNGGPWDGCNYRFENMAKTAEGISKRGCIPGIWFRSLLTLDKLPADMVLKCPKKDFSSGVVMDPSHHDALERIYNDTKSLYDRGYRLIKHDFSTIDLCAEDPGSGWSFYDKSKTTAQIAKELYKTIQRGAKDALVIGCNTFGHLSAGIHQLQRVSGDTSGRAWEWTRRRGVTSMMRLPQNNTFFRHDPDCAAITDKVSFELNYKFMELIAITGTAFFMSITPNMLTSEQKKRISFLYTKASKDNNFSEPLDWMSTNSPSEFSHDGKEYCFDWYNEHGGARAFPTWLK